MKPRLSETDFQQTIIDLAKALGWHVAHFRGVRVQRHDGSVYYQTPVQADGAGFPDLVLAHKDWQRTIFAELKNEKGNLSPEQYEWLQILSANQGIEVYEWKPSEFEEIKRVLSRC